MLNQRYRKLKEKKKQKKTHEQMGEISRCVFDVKYIVINIVNKKYICVHFHIHFFFCSNTQTFDIIWMKVDLDWWSEKMMARMIKNIARLHPFRTCVAVFIAMRCMLYGMFCVRFYVELSICFTPALITTKSIQYIVYGLQIHSNSVLLLHLV